jgi:hypothetical protein
MSAAALSINGHAGRIIAAVDDAARARANR